MFRLVLISLSSLFLISCASPSKKECEEMNWRDVGYNLGKDGASTEQEIEKYNKICKKQHGVAINQALFQEGYSAGLATFCHSKKGYILGTDGEPYSYPAICPKKLEEAFRSRYKAGLKYFCAADNFLQTGIDGKPFRYPDICDAKYKAQAKAAYDKGVKRHCTYEVGFHIGNAGEKYKNICPESIEDRYLKGYTLGVQNRSNRKIAELTEKIKSLESNLESQSEEIQALRSRLNTMQNEVDRNQSDISSLKGDLSTITIR